MQRVQKVDIVSGPGGLTEPPTSVEDPGVGLFPFEKTWEGLEDLPACGGLRHQSRAKPSVFGVHPR